MKVYAMPMADGSFLLRVRHVSPDQTDRIGDLTHILRPGETVLGLSWAHVDANGPGEYDVRPRPEEEEGEDG